MNAFQKNCFDNEKSFQKLVYFAQMLAKKEVLNKIVQLGSLLSEGTEIFLFGSRANGKAKPDSDWDLLILLSDKEVNLQKEKNVMDSFYELELQTGEVFSPIIYSKSHWNSYLHRSPLFEKILKEGKKLS